MKLSVAETVSFLPNDVESCGVIAVQCSMLQPASRVNTSQDIIQRDLTDSEPLQNKLSPLPQLEYSALQRSYCQQCPA